jgi:hypothetical protein
MSKNDVSIIPNDPIALKAVKDCIFEISASMTRIESERDFIKEAINNVAEKHKISKKHLRKAAVSYHKSNLQQTVEQTKEVVELYMKVFPDSDTVAEEKVEL